jgi:predicted lipid-binding transport protein (Tim44 family)
LETIIYAIIAGILIYRLYTILGQRDGNEQNRPSWRSGNPFAPKQNNPQGQDKPVIPPKAANVNKDDLLALPLASPKSEPQVNMPNQPFATEPAQESLAGALFAIQKADVSFDERSFLKGARLAFEMIVRGFAAGERGTLKNLLTPKLYVAFEQAISARELQGERWEIKTLTVRDMDIVDARLEGGVAYITVQCTSDQSKCVYDKNGSLIKDPGREVDRLTDIWTFKRDTKTNNPNWQLAETRSE